MTPADLLTRRNLLIATGALLLAPKGHAAEPAHAAHAGSAVTPEAAMARLMAGNQRYSQGAAAHAGQDARRRAALAAGQQPFATILACADSRVAPEIVFDQGLGDLFVVRVAGNVVDD